MNDYCQHIRFMLYLYSTVAGRYKAADPSKEGEPMGDVLTLFLVVFAAMTFVVVLITLIVMLIKAMSKK